ncbi:hypothetical protein UFOVP116_141 [uncultured Caudovirales phage]|uniref:Uncharacterized protein n=1 Tax=uncultured Caudovirales phage TaxID=2100421 RepID=A0A6J5L947_9CAUD|nr:hypothetical protein UFOVP116_141 [uncultured Caudovirales phage]
MSDGGKGSAPRKQQDQEAYSKNWDAIFGKKEKKQSLVESQINNKLDIYDNQDRVNSMIAKNNGCI